MNDFEVQVLNFPNSASEQDLCDLLAAEGLEVINAMVDHSSGLCPTAQVMFMSSEEADKCLDLPKAYVLNDIELQIVGHAKVHKS